MYGYADASISAYGSCLHFCTTYWSSTSSSTLVSSKSRIAPVKSVTLRRLGLA